MLRIFRPLTALLCAVLMAAFLPAKLPAMSDTVYAAENYQSDKKYLKAQQYIASQLEKTPKAIDIRSFGLTLDELAVIYSDIMLTRTDIFYLGTQYKYTYIVSSNTALTLIPEYIYDKELISSYKKQMESAAKSILSKVKSSWPDEQKALYIHDRLILTCDFDDTIKTYSAYEVLGKKKGQCTSYSMAYKYLLDKAGIESIIVNSEEMYHSWNMVKIKNKWYHVDVSWDDSSSNIKGYAGHKYFMLSDKAIMKADHPHTGWKSQHTADSKKYDNAYWHYSDSEIVPIGKYRYYVDNTTGAICRCSTSTGKTETIKKLYENTKEDGTVCTRLVYYGGELYFNTAYKICKLDLSTREYTTVRKPALDENSIIYGFSIKSGKLSYQTTEA